MSDDLLYATADEWDGHEEDDADDWPERDEDEADDGEDVGAALAEQARALSKAMGVTALPPARHPRYRSSCPSS